MYSRKLLLYSSVASPSLMQFTPPCNHQAPSKTGRGHEATQWADVCFYRRSKFFAA